MTNECNESPRVLQRIFTWKHNSLAAYIAAAEPYVKSGQKDLLKLVKSFADEDRRLRDAAAELMGSLEMVPRIEPHPHYVSDLNYLAIDYLAGVLEQELCSQLAELKQSAGAYELSAQTAAFVQSAADVIERQLTALRNMLFDNSSRTQSA